MRSSETLQLTDSLQLPKSRLPMSKIPETHPLQDLSESTQNARYRTMQPPPPVNGLKRKGHGEQAVEGSRPAPPPPGSRVPHKSAKGGSLKSLNRQNSFASSVSSSRPASAASSSFRNASNGSTFSQSLGPPRSPSSQSSRPQSAMSGYSNGPRYGISSHRSANSLDQTGKSARNASAQGPNNNSMRKFSSSRQVSASRKKDQPPQESDDNQSECSTAWLSSIRRVPSRQAAENSRNISISTQMGMLSLDDHHVWREEGTERSKIDRICTTPKTPSQIPKKKSSTLFTPAPTPDVFSPTKAPRKTPKPAPTYLTKGTNVQAAGWDVTNRIERVESLYTEMKSQLEAANGERDNFKETLSLLKTQSMTTERCQHVR